MVKILKVSGAIVFLLGLLGYFGAGYMVFSETTKKKPCRYITINSPEKYSLEFWDVKQKDDFSPWFFKNYEKIKIPSLSEGVQLEAYLVEQDPKKPWILFVHGVGVCKEKQEVIFPMGVAVKAGFNALSIDLNDHGGSTGGDGLINAGLSEYKDVIGAWKYLNETKKVPSNRIGIHGASMGAGSVAIAFAKEKEIKNVWLDSVYFTMEEQMKEYLVFLGFPSSLFFPANLMGNLVGGMDLSSLEPGKAAKEIGDRNMFVTHNLPDLIVQSKHGKKMCETAKEHVTEQGSIECWYTDVVRELADTPFGPKKATHVVAAISGDPVEYERRMVSYWNRVLK
jgi:hypothetical protein